eukprot:gene54060-15873_t
MGRAVLSPTFLAAAAASGSPWEDGWPAVVSRHGDPGTWIFLVIHVPAAAACGTLRAGPAAVFAADVARLTSCWCRRHRREGGAQPESVTALDLLLDAEVSPLDGLWLQFGVMAGGSLRVTAAARRRRLKREGRSAADGMLHGFDTFSGLPKSEGGWSQGRYSLKRRGKTLIGYDTYAANEMRALREWVAATRAELAVVAYPGVRERRGRRERLRGESMRQMWERWGRIPITVNCSHPNGLRGPTDLGAWDPASQTVAFVVMSHAPLPAWRSECTG